MGRTKEAPEGASLTGVLEMYKPAFAVVTADGGQSCALTLCQGTLPALLLESLTFHPEASTVPRPRLDIVYGHTTLNTPISSDLNWA